MSSRSLDDAFWPHIASVAICLAIRAELQCPAASQHDIGDADVFADARESVFSRMPSATVSETPNCAINRVDRITVENIPLGKLSGMTRIIMHFDAELNCSRFDAQRCSLARCAQSRPAESQSQRMPVSVTEVSERTPTALAVWSFNFSLSSRF